MVNLTGFFAPLLLSLVSTVITRFGGILKQQFRGGAVQQHYLQIAPDNPAPPFAYLGVQLLNKSTILHGAIALTTIEGIYSVIIRGTAQTTFGSHYNIMTLLSSAGPE